MPIDPELRERLLLDHALGALSEDCAALLAVALDDEGRARMRRDQELVDLARAVLRPAPASPPPWAPVRRPRLWIAAAAAAAAMAMAAMALLARGPARGEPPTVARISPSTTSGVPDFWAVRRLLPAGARP